MTNATNEEWRVVADFPDYEVSSLGRLRCCRDRRYLRAGEIVKIQHSPKGYPIAWIDGKTRLVQRIVCRAFHGVAPFGHEVAHRNGIKRDIRAENLRWDTHAGNCADKKMHGTENPPRGEKSGHAKLTADDVITIRSMAEQAVTQSEIAEQFGVARSTISSIHNRYNWRHL